MVLYLPTLIEVNFFFFQAEDGIRDRNVTGVQTCALPIFATKALISLPAGKFSTGTARIPFQLDGQVIASLEDGCARRWMMSLFLLPVLYRIETSACVAHCTGLPSASILCTSPTFNSRIPVSTLLMSPTTTQTRWLG